jgi:hypothetical protein
VPIVDPERRRAYQAAWHAANAVRLRERNRAWYVANREHVLDAVREYAAANPEVGRAAKRKYAAAHPDSWREYAAANPEGVRARRNKWTAAHPDYESEYAAAHPEVSRARRRKWRAAHPNVGREYAAAHPEVGRAAKRKYAAAHPDAERIRTTLSRAHKLAAVGTHSPTDVRGRWAMYGNRCWMCGEPATATDHVKPLIKGGSNWPANLRPVCKPCNSHKSATWPYTTVPSNATRLARRLGVDVQQLAL